MKNHALKLVKEKSSASLKVQDLIKFPEDDFNNLKKESLYEQGKFYHRKQKGILRVSKYEFYSTRENRLSDMKKNQIEICKYKNGFDYIESKSSDTKIWYMNYADRQVFCNRDTKSFTLEDLQIMNMPLLYKVNRFLNTDPFVSVTTSTFYKDGNQFIPTPILFENVPQWYDVKNTDDLKKNQPILKDKRNNIISMIAPFGTANFYAEEELYFLCKSLFAGYGGIVQQAKKSKVTEIELHTGDWGCGFFCNNKELIYLSQMCTASIMGFKKICFHKVSEPEYNSALEKYNNLKEELNFEQLVAYLFLQKYDRKNNGKSISL